jgi:hypothetical protein
MARTHDLAGMTPGQLHALGIETLDMSLSAAHGDLGRASAQATQAMALFFASLSADNLDELAGSHRAPSLDREAGAALKRALAEDKTLGERVHDG